uniref:6-phosphogluconolactonase n=1 Tax=Hyaloperonospora arabidopsidis (strain Emoy2) TaxID=559515 RepID=M4B320_HYAAE
MPTLYVGTYTRKEPHVDGHATGIHAYSFNDVTGALNLLQITPDVGINPSYVIGTDSTLYVVNECNDASKLRPGDETGFVIAYALSSTGLLRPISRHETGGTYSCHVALSLNGDFVSVANYNGGLSLYPVLGGGSLAPASHHCRLKGASLVHPDRQEASHIHSTVWTPTGLLAADLGTDSVVQYTLNVNNKQLEHEELISCRPGSGPRHFALSIELGVCYVLGELDNTVGVYAFDASTGKLNPETLQTISTLPKDYEGPTALASDIHISPTNNFVYAATRFSNTIAIYEILPDTRLQLVDIVPTRGATPRDILLFKDFLLVGNQDSDSLDVFRVDEDTGKITYTGNSVECPSPSCMFIAQ